MSGQHTPGEWIVFTNEDEWGCDTFVGTLTDTLFDVRPWKGPAWTEGNARLAAAAPDLLEALQGLIYGDEITKERARHKGIAAIAKAEGRS